MKLTLASDGRGRANARKTSQIGACACAAHTGLCKKFGKRERERGELYLPIAQTGGRKRECGGGGGGEKRRGSNERTSQVIFLPLVHNGLRQVEDKARGAACKDLSDHLLYALLSFLPQIFSDRVDPGCLLGNYKSIVEIDRREAGAAASVGRPAGLEDFRSECGCGGRPLQASLMLLPSGVYATVSLTDRTANRHFNSSLWAGP